MITMVTLLSLIVLAAYAGVVAYMASNLKRYSTDPVSSSGEFVTIIVAARNEEPNISRCISSILAQSHTGFEVFIVNDSSDDATESIAMRFSEQDERVRVIRLEQSAVPQKKLGIETAIAKSRGSIIVTTDADCTHQRNWLSAMLNEYSKGRKMVCGPVRIGGTGIFDKLQALEFSGLIGVTSSSIEKCTPVMCNGANLVFSRDAFYLTGGYSSNRMIASGDDIFLMRQIQEMFPGSVGFCHHKEAIVKTNACRDLQSFISQRIRWVSKMRNIKPSVSAAVIGSTVVMQNAILTVLAALSIFSDTFVFLFFTILLGKTFLDGIFLYVSAKNLEQKNLLWLLPVFEIFYLPYSLMLALGSMKRNYNWKDREVRI